MVINQGIARCKMIFSIPPKCRASQQSPAPIRLQLDPFDFLDQISLCMLQLQRAAIDIQWIDDRRFALGLKVVTRLDDLMLGDDPDDTGLLLLANA